MTKRAVLGKAGQIHTVILDGVVVGQSLDLDKCEGLAEELNESDEKCDFLLLLIVE